MRCRVTFDRVAPIVLKHLHMYTRYHTVLRYHNLEPFPIPAEFYDDVFLAHVCRMKQKKNYYHSSRVSLAEPYDLHSKVTVRLF